MSLQAKRFKKGDLVTRIASYDRTGTVFVQHFIVASWGAKQATLKHVGDNSNALFRVYTDWAGATQGLHSWHFMLTADFSEAFALKLAEEWIADDIQRSKDRLAFAKDRAANKPETFDARYGTAESYLKWETELYERDTSRPFKAAVNLDYKGR